MTPADLVCDHGSAPAGVSPVAAAFIQPFLPDFGFPELGQIIGSSEGLDPTLLAEGILRSLDIPDADIGSATLGKAWEVYGDVLFLGSIHRGVSLPILCATAASLAGEALSEWIRSHAHPSHSDSYWPKLGGVNHPCTVLTKAYRWVHGQACHAD